MTTDSGSESADGDASVDDLEDASEAVTDASETVEDEDASEAVTGDPSTGVNEKTDGSINVVDGPRGDVGCGKGLTGCLTGDGCLTGEPVAMGTFF